MPTEKGNVYTDELKRFLGKEVLVLDTNEKEHKGTLVAIGFPYLNVVLRQDKYKIVIKNINSIHRVRSHPIEEKQ